MAPSTRPSRQGRAGAAAGNGASAKVQQKSQNQASTQGAGKKSRNKSRGGWNQEEYKHRWLASALGVESPDDNSKGAKTEGKKKRGKDEAPVGFQTPHGATAPDSAAFSLEAEQQRVKASLLRVAGFRDAQSKEDVRWSEWEDDEYDWISARCDEETPLGMPVDYCSRFDSYGSSHEVEDERQALLVSGLPNDLGPFTQVMFEQAGLKGQILDWQFEQGSNQTGRALVWVANRKLAEYAQWHFQGCSWVKDIKVQASLVATPASIERSESLTEKVLEELLAPPEEWFIDCHGNCVFESDIQPMQAQPVSLYLVPMEATMAYPYNMLTEAEQGSPAGQQLSTIWEETCSDLVATEVSTDAGASASISGASEAEDCHEGEEGSD